jgi:SAM-dependent methyltransferase
MEVEIRWRLGLRNEDHEMNMTENAQPTAREMAVEHWNRTPLFLAEEQRYAIYPWLYDVAEFRSHRGERVLEVGCGTGCDLLQFARHGAQAYGIDVTTEHLKLARQRVAGAASVVFGDATAIPFPSSSFDYVYSHGVIHHIENPRDVVLEIMRVLRPGGRFNVHVYSLFSYFTAWSVLRHPWDWKRQIENSRDPVHIDLYTALKLRRLFAPTKIVTRKYHSKVSFEPYLGWYLVAKGVKPK